ncbi:hypothetical protein [Levilactobacillus bambusae]|uniref:hypothetical protein n=1 Tax=Levilactobacillus bambusae TaxID=2024736 RepID=UPI0014041FBF|nr:hypothetical protein [Levilactobacillus bambusae]
MNIVDGTTAASLVAFLVTLIAALYKFVRPIVTTKVESATSQKTKNALELGLKLSDAIVPEMAVMQDLSGSDRKKEAIRFVNDQLQKNGYKVDVSALSALVEQAYQAYKTTGGDNHKTIEVVTDEPAKGDD